MNGPLTAEDKVAPSGPAPGKRHDGAPEGDGKGDPQGDLAQDRHAANSSSAAS